MRPKDRELAETLEASLLKFSQDVEPLNGIASAPRMQAFVRQLVDSIHRVRYRSVLLTRDISPRRADPNDDLFDPLRAAISYLRVGEREEAFWCIFLFIHFGKHSRGAWRYAREIYGRLGDGGRWDWAHVSAAPGEFREWLRQNGPQLQRPGVAGGFGNHRKYESLDADSDRGTGAAVESYVQWVAPPRTHVELFASAYDQNEMDPCKTFNWLYRSMKAVRRFGRIARFEYLANVGAIGLAPIEPDCAYLTEATGPKKGAKLLFRGRTDAHVPNKELERLASELGFTLGIGMQELEDAICNWQKSPSAFRPFRG